MPLRFSQVPFYTSAIHYIPESLRSAGGAGFRRGEDMGENE